MTFTVTYCWWMTPILIVCVGGLWAKFIMSSSRGGMFDFSPIAAAAAFFASVAVALAFTVGHWLA